MLNVKLNPLIVLIVIFLGIIVGAVINKDASLKASSAFHMDAYYGKKGQENHHIAGLTPNYVMEYLEENGFSINPVYSDTKADIYTAKIIPDHTNVIVQVDVYYERTRKEIILIETNIDGRNHIEDPDIKKAVELVTDVANTYFFLVAAIPYDSNQMEEWVKLHITGSYFQTPKVKTSARIGMGTINILGDPLFRTLELDFGYTDLFSRLDGRLRNGNIYERYGVRYFRDPSLVSQDMNFISLM